MSLQIHFSFDFLIDRYSLRIIPPLIVPFNREVTCISMKENFLIKVDLEARDLSSLYELFNLNSITNVRS